MTTKSYYWNEIEKLEADLTYYRVNGFDDDSSPVQQVIKQLKELYELVETHDDV